MARCGSAHREGCGKEILWGFLPGGRKVPLDLSGLVYRRGPWDPNLNAHAVDRVEGHYIDHRIVCPFSSFNSKGKPAKPAPAPPSGRDRQAGD